MAKVQAMMSKTGSKVAGYYNHRRIKVGEVFNMKEVDEDGFYFDPDDKDGKKLKLGKDKKPVKCQWVGKIGSLTKKKIDPKAVAAVLSGKHPGEANPGVAKEE